MKRTESKRHAGQLHDSSDALVALYLTENTGLPCDTKDYEITSFQATDSDGTRADRRALKVTFRTNTSIERQSHLLTFGSDAQRCNVLLEVTEASPVHCKIYAQMNSGPDVWVVEDTSANGTEYVDGESRLTGVSKKVVGRRVATLGLCRIRIGRNIFTLWPPSDELELSRREHWFQNLDPILVTQNLLREQLRGAVADYRPICRIGQGGMGNVFMYMELTTGLMIAVKEEEVKQEGADERIQKEIAHMQKLRHPNLVDYIMSTSAIRAGLKCWFTAMPLYQGRLCDILPLGISALEDVMLQLFEGVNYMHGQQVLHKDIKPENILVKGKSRPDVVLADYGICASLNNRADLMGAFGTRGFAAPEVSRMIVQTQAVDVFALGATFFVILEPERCKGQHATVTTLENVMRRPPKVYGGLVQSMMAHDPQERPSLKECFDIVKARKRDWKKRTPLVLPPSSVPAPSGLRRSQRNQKAVVQEPSILNLASFTARRPSIAVIAEARRSRIRPRQQEVPAGLDFKMWGQMGRIQGPRASGLRIPQMRQLQAPAAVQRVDFSVRPPPLPNLFGSPDVGSAPNATPPAHRQAAPAIQEPARTPIRKPDNDTKRKIRRGPERRKMVESWHKIRVQKNKVCDGAGELASGTPLNIVRGLHKMTKASLGFTGQYINLIFNDLAVALPALLHVAPQTKPWGLTTNKRLMYGLKSQGIWPMTPEEYEAERLQSELNFPNTTEGRRAQAVLDAKLRERDRHIIREMRELRRLDPVRHGGPRVRFL